MPASDMMFEEIPRNDMGMKARSTEMGIVRMGTIAEGMCQRNSRMTRLTMIIWRTSSCLSVSIARWMREERS